METTLLPAAEGVQRLPLAGHHHLLLERRSSSSTLWLVGSGGQVRLAIEVTADGPVLRFEGCGLQIQVAGDLAIEAGRLALHGREGLSLTSGGELCVDAAGDLHSQARVQHIEAVLGNV